jgi:peroxiredoxin
MSLSYKVTLFLLPLCLVATTFTRAADDKLVGTQVMEWQLTDWLNSKPLTLKDQRGKVILVRWWTGGGCPFCAATAPALKEFHSKYSAEGLVVVGVYHHKEKKPLELETVKQCVRDFGFQFPVAVDPDWQTLKSWWLKDADRKWTSVSFLIDKKGVIRHIHPGGSYRKGDKAYQTMQNKIEELLKEE